MKDWRIKVFTEIDMRSGCKHLRYIRFHLDDNKNFCYRSRTSINAFAHSMKQRNYYPNVKNAELLYHLQQWDDLVASNELLKKALGGKETFFDKVPVIDVKNIWEFYELVGYDYKKQKWAKDA